MLSGAAHQIHTEPFIAKQNHKPQRTTRKPATTLPVQRGPAPRSSEGQPISTVRRPHCALWFTTGLPAPMLTALLLPSASFRFCILALESVRANPSFWLPWHVEEIVLVWTWKPQGRLPLPATQWPAVLPPQPSVAHLFPLLL